jgi:hypothetical protein
MVGFGFVDEVIDITPTLRRIPDIRPNVGTGNIVPSRAEIPLVTEREGLEDAIRIAQDLGASPRELQAYAAQGGAYIPLSPEAQRLARDNADILDNREFQRQLQEIDNLSADINSNPISNAGGILDGASTALDLGALIAGASGAQVAAGLLGYAGAVLGAGGLGMLIGDQIRRQLGEQWPETFLYPDERLVNLRERNLADPDIDIPEGSREYDPETDWQCPTNYAGSITVIWQDSVIGPGSTTDGFTNAPGPLRLEVDEISGVQGTFTRYSVKHSENATAVSRTTPPQAVGIQFYHNINRIDNGYDNCGRLDPIQFSRAFDTIADRMRGLPNIGPYGEPMPTGDNSTPFAPRVPGVRPRVPVFPDFDYPDNEPSGEDERDPFIPPTPPYLPTDPFGPIVSPPTDYGEPNNDPAGRPIGGGEPTGNPDPDYDIRNPECCVDPGIGRILELLRGIETALKVEALTIDVTPCEAEENVTINSQDALGSNFEALAQGIEKLHDLVKCPPQVDTVLPEIFLSKSPRIKPQCKITYTNEGSSWALTIPQFNTDLKDFINLSPYQKGNVMCVLDLLDNSSITLNAISEGEGIRVIGELVQYVLPQFVPSDWMSRIKVTKYNRNLSTKLVTPKQAKYWSEGDMRSVADWIRKLT